MTSVTTEPGARLVTFVPDFDDREALPRTVRLGDDFRVAALREEPSTALVPVEKGGVMPPTR